MFHSFKDPFYIDYEKQFNETLDAIHERNVDRHIQHMINAGEDKQSHGTATIPTKATEINSETRSKETNA